MRIEQQRLLALWLWMIGYVGGGIFSVMKIIASWVKMGTDPGSGAQFTTGVICLCLALGVWGLGVYLGINEKEVRDAADAAKAD